MVTQNMGIPSTFYTMRHFSGLCSFIFWFFFLTSLAILLIFFSVTELFIFEKTSDKFFNVKTGWMKAFDFWRVLGVPKQPPQTIWVVTNFIIHILSCIWRKRHIHYLVNDYSIRQASRKFVIRRGWEGWPMARKDRKVTISVVVLDLCACNCISSPVPPRMNLALMLAPAWPNCMVREFSHLNWRDLFDFL